jgi:hypothetical protein
MAQDPMHDMPAETPSTDAWIGLPGPEALGAMPADHPYNFGFNAAMYRLIGAHQRIGMAFGRLYARIMFSPGVLTRAEREMVAGVAAAAQDLPLLNAVARRVSACRRRRGGTGRGDKGAAMA